VIDLEEVLSRKLVTEPPKRWFNWYRTTDGYEFEDETSPARGPNAWPSHEIAEQKALMAIEKCAVKGRWPRGSVEWAGAFPENETP